MLQSPFIDDSDLARARRDIGSRQRLLIESLELLLGELSKRRRAAHGPAPAEQVREGVELAVKLADLLRRIAQGAPRAA